MRYLFLDALKAVSRYRSKKEIEDLCFKSLIDSYQRVKRIKGIEQLNENKIRDAFVVDLETNNLLIKHAIDNFIVIVVPESWDVIRRRRTDIRFILPLLRRNLVFECKKLRSADRRYFEEGLVRFIRLEYSEEETNAGMLGFVVRPKDLPDIVSNLRESTCKFHFLRLIDEPLFGWPFSFQSVHVRIDAREIVIGHLFFPF